MRVPVGVRECLRVPRIVLSDKTQRDTNTSIVHVYIFCVNDCCGLIFSSELPKRELKTKQTNKQNTASDLNFAHRRVRTHRKVAPMCERKNDFSAVLTLPRT